MTRRDLPSPVLRPARYGAVTLVAVGILVASVVDPPSSGPTPLGPLGLVGLDKWLHALAYGALAAVLAVTLVPPTGAGGARGAPRTREPRPLRVALACTLVVVLAAGYGLGIELVQGTLPYRSFDPADFAANAVGALLVALGWGVAVARQRVRPLGE